MILKCPLIFLQCSYPECGKVKKWDKWVVPDATLKPLLKETNIVRSRCPDHENRASDPEKPKAA